MSRFYSLRGAGVVLRGLIVVALLLALAPANLLASVAATSATIREPDTAFAASEKASGNRVVEGFSITGGFDPTASMSMARASHVAIRLLDGRVLVAGGGSDLRSAEIYDPTTETWSPTGSLVYGRYGHAAVQLSDGRVMVVGGVSANVCSSPPVSNSAEIYDPATGAWTLTSSMIASRHLPLAIVLADGRVLVAGGGSRCGSVYTSAEIYSPTTGIWNSTGSMTVAREIVRGVRLPDGRVLVAGGTGSHPFASLASAEIYNPTTGTWTATGSLHEARLWPGRSGLTLLSNGLVLAVGGYLRYCDVGTCAPPMTLSSTELYDPSTGLWTLTASLAHPRLNHALATLSSGKVLITGGIDLPTGTVFNDAELYDPVAGTLTVIPATMTSTRYEHSATSLVDGRVLITGGYQEPSDTQLSSAEIYTDAPPNPGVNIAYNPTGTGFPHPLESNNGWGGGSYPWDMLDGQTYYTDTWAHGLAFTGGFPGWIEPCGWRQATIDFGAMKTFSRMRVYHHGDEHIPNTYHVEYWDGSAWQTINASSALREDLRVPPPGVAGWGAVPTEHVFAPVTGSKARFVMNNCDIQHGWIYELEVYSAVETGPHLEIPEQVPGLHNQIVTMPVRLTRNGTDLATTVFSVDYDQACLHFDPADADGDGNPDAVHFSLPAAFQGSVTFDGNDIDGELDFFIGDIFPPLSGLPDSTLASIDFLVSCQPPSGTPILARVGFSTDPAASFGATNGHSVSGTTTDGSVAITAVSNGDCNTDIVIDAGDISATVLEIFDGDGNLPQNAPGGTFPGDPVGCNANADTLIDAGDIACTVLLIFYGQAACGAPLRLSDQENTEHSASMPALRLLFAETNKNQLTIPVQFDPGDYAISSVVFALTYDPAVVTIDPVDADGDGVSDAVTFDLPRDFQATGIVNNQAGVLQIMVTDGAVPLANLQQQVIARITWDIKADVTDTEGKVSFSVDAPASFGDTLGRSIAGITLDR